MPNCFQLINKETGKPELPQVVDQKMCEFFGEPVDDVQWFREWYNWVGFALACGRDFDYLRQQQVEMGNDDFVQLIDWLELNYTSDAWYEAKC